MVDPVSGVILHQHPSPVAAFNMQIAGVFGGRALVIQAASKAPSPLTLADVETGEALARSWVDDDLPIAASTTRDGKRVYVGGSGTISSLEIPPRD